MQIAFASAKEESLFLADGVGARCRDDIGPDLPQRYDVTGLGGPDR